MTSALEYLRVAVAVTVFFWPFLASQRSSSAAEPGPPTIVEGCLCKIDEKARTLTLVPVSKEKNDLDLSATKTLAYDKQTQFTLKCTVTSVDLGGGRAKKLEVEDGELKNQSALPGHKVKVTFVERGARPTVASIKLIPGWGSDSDSLLAGVGGLAIFITTRCSCASR